MKHFWGFRESFARHRWRRVAGSSLLAGFLLFSASLGLWAPPTAEAATFNAANVSQLVSAINNSNGNGQDNVINLTSTGTTYNLTSALPAITGKITINGNNKTIQRSTSTSASFSLFTVQASGKLTLNSLTLTNGKNTNGGALVNSGTATLNNVIVRNNSATNGGGIYNTGSLTLVNVQLTSNTATNGNGGGLKTAGGSVSVSGSTISGNSASVNGGGFSVDGGATAAILSSTISGNTAATNGGGFSVDSSYLSLSVATVNNNTATNGNGGGVVGLNGTISVVSSTVQGNLAAINGGGFSVDGGSLSISGSTIASNSATISGGGFSVDGGSQFTLSNDTSVSSNQAGTNGGGFSVDGGSTGTLSGSTTVSSNCVGTSCTSATASFLAQARPLASSIAGATTFGGGFSVDGGSTVTISSSTISSNSSSTLGGGFSVDGGGFSVDTITAFKANLISGPSTVIISGSTLSGNTAVSGGGFSVDGNSSSVSVDSSLLSSNTATNGGGFSVDNAATGINLTNTTIAGNVATVDGGGFSVDNAGGATATNLTIANNCTGPTCGASASAFVANSSAGGQTIRNAAGTNVVLKNTILSNNNGNGNCAATPAGSSSFNLEYPLNTCGSSSLASPDNPLDPTGLKDNGGPTKSIALADTSAASNGGPASTNCPAQDQRFIASPSCDLGAVKSNGLLPGVPTVLQSFAPAQIAPGATTTLYLTINNNNAASKSGSVSSPLNLTGLTVLATLDAGLQIAANPNLGGTCPANKVVATAGGSTINLSGLELAPFASCTVNLNVTSAQTGSFTSKINGIAAAQLGSIVFPAPLSTSLKVQSSGSTDTVPPTIVVFSPAPNATFAVGQSVKASFKCFDNVAVNSCSGTPFADGANLDTSTPGSKTLTINAKDSAGNPNSVTIKYVVSNPSPLLTSLGQFYVVAGGPAFTLTVNGSNFVSSSKVNWNGSPRPTTFVSNTQLKAQITQADIASQGIVPITVNSGSGGTSNALNFYVAVLSCDRPDLSQLSDGRALQYDTTGSPDSVKPLANLADPYDYTFWRWTNTPKAVYLQLKFDTFKTISSLQIFSHDPTKAPSVYFQYSADGVNWSDIDGLNNVDAAPNHGWQNFQIGKITDAKPKGGITAKYFRLVTDNISYLYDLGYFSDIKACSLSANGKPVLVPTLPQTLYPHRLPIANAYDTTNTNDLTKAVPEVLDNVPHTNWQVSGRPQNAKLVVDLGQSRSFSSIIYFATYSGVAKDTKIEVSDDPNFGSSTVIADHLNTGGYSPPPPYGSYTISGFGTVSGRYIRFTITNTDNSWILGGYGEINVVGN